MLGGSSPESLGARMQRYAGGTQTATPEAKKERKKSRRDIDPFATLSGDVQDKRFSSRVQRDLARADLRLRVAEYYYIRIGLSLGLAAVLLLLRDPLSAAVGAFLGYFLPRMWVGRRIGSRLNAFNKQLPDTITLLSNSLRAGSSFLQSIELVSRESPAPMGPEMGRVVREVNLGLSMEEALSNLVRRIKGEIRTLTAQGRYSGYLVAFLPIAIMITLNFINPEFMQPLFTELIGQILLAVGAIMMTIGFFAIQKITDIKV